MNELQILNNFIIDKFSENPLVKTITTVPSIDIDGNNENIYQLVNIDLIDTVIETDAVIANYKITVIQQRDFIPNKTDSKLLIDTNYLDNINETHYTCTKFVNYLRWKNNDNNIEIQSLSSFKKLQNWGQGQCDGFQFTIELSIHNKGIA